MLDRLDLSVTMQSINQYFDDNYTANVFPI